MDDGHIVVDSIEEIEISDITYDLARESGFESVEDLLKIAKHGSGDNVYLIRFHYLPAGAWDTRAILPLTFLACASLACQPAPDAQPPLARYFVTESPIDVGVGPRICVAVDPADAHGIWWWQPGRTGCSSRSTGPSVFHGEDASVSPPTPGLPVAVAFRIGTHSTTRPFVDVRLVIENDRLRVSDSGAHVALQRRNDLEVPEAPGAS